MTLRDQLQTLFIMAVWGLNFVVAKWGLQELPPLFLMAMRFMLVAALLVPFAKFPRGRLKPIAFLAVTMGAVHFPLLFYGLRGIDAATASIVAQVQVPLASALAAFLFKDKLGWKRSLGMALAFAGVAVITGGPRPPESVYAILMILGASLAFAVANMQMKLLGDVNGFTINGWMALFAAPELLAMSFLIEDGQWQALLSASWLAWFSVVFMAVGVTIITYGMWYPLLRRYSVNQTVPWLLTVPVFGVASGVLLMDDPLTMALAIGGTMTIAGVAMIVRPHPASVSAKGANPT